MGQYSWAVKALVSQGLDNSSKALDILWMKHPQIKDGHDLREDRLPPPLQLLGKQVKDALFSFKPGIAGGPSGI